jgi:menaquinone-dependent protoporphyrinogen oxidase
MSSQMLVAYASKYGATQEIAEKIADVLREAHLTVDVLPADEVNMANTYRGVVLGSAVYAGQWRKEAVAMLETMERTLAERPVWLFSSGPTGEGDADHLLKGWRFPAAQQPIADRIQPREITVFHGDIEMNKLNFGEKLIIKGVRAQTGDYRDWEAIKAWARQIAHVMRTEVLKVTT